jgi:aldehyde oxidoreductase
MLDTPQAAAPTMSLIVNGEIRNVAADPFRPLSDTLREGLGLTGTKVGCEAGDCGACTVLIDGAQVCACLIATGQAAGARIETVEGPGPNGLTDTLRHAFLEHGAAQCGICTPGMLMAATDLLARNAAPTQADVEDALGGVLCRCTGYTKIIEAVLAVADNVMVGLRPDHPMPRSGFSGLRSASPANDASAIGQRIPRLDGWAKVAGTDLFGADFAPPDALWMRVVRSPHARATFVLGDLEAVRAATPGLAAIFTHADVPGENSFGIFPHLKDQPVLAPCHVRYRGEAVLALVGTREAVEGLADSALPIHWQVEPAVIGVDQGLAEGAPVLHAFAPDNVLARGNLKMGDVEKGHAAGFVTATGSFTTGFVEHAYIEPEAGYAVRVGDRIEVTACTQAPYMDLEEVARVLGLSQDAVRIIPSACGGGFGGKLDVSVQPLLAVAAWALNKPVRIIYSRIESMASSTKRHPSRITAKASADAAGRLTAYELEGDFNTGAYASWGPTVANRVPVHGAGPYKVPNVWNRTRAVYTNETPAGAFRGFGVPQAAIANETLMDDLAEKLGMDRWAIRWLNALGHRDVTYSGHRLMSSTGLLECLHVLRDDWDQVLARVASHNESATRLRRGAGIACMWYGCGNTSMSNPSTMRITLGADGKLTFWNGAVDIGQGSTTILTQMAAEALGLPVSAFKVVVGDTDLTADAGKTSASRQTYVSGNAARLAGEALRARILKLANAGPNARLALDGATLTISDGETVRSIDLGSLAADDGGIVLEGIATWDPPTTKLDADGQGIPYGTYGFAAQIAEVEVDIELGTVEVLNIIAAHDVGRAINPTLVEGQIHGGIAQGLGLALMEEFIPGKTENLHDYLIPTTGDMPTIKTYLIEDPEETGPFGAKGVGEPALVATAPAILGAIRHACGARMTQVPVLPHRLWAALKGSV